MESSTARFYRLCSWVATLGLLFVLVLQTHSALAASSWSSLNTKQQELLSGLKPDWERMSDSQQEKWIKVSKQYEKASPDTQEKMRERVTVWAKMSPAEKEAARRNYRALRYHNRGERNSNWNSYQTLKPEQKSQYKETQAERREQTDLNPFVTPGAAAYNR